MSTFRNTESLFFFVNYLTIMLTDEVEEEDQEIPIIKPSTLLKNLMDAERFYLYHGENELAKQAKSLMKKSKQFHDAAFKQQDIRTFFRS